MKFHLPHNGKQGGFLPSSPFRIPVVWILDAMLMSVVRNRPEKYFNMLSKAWDSTRYHYCFINETLQDAVASETHTAFPSS